MGKPTAWMKFYISDYLADTAHLTTIQHGAYLLLIFHYWRTGPLADDDEELSTIARMDVKSWRSQVSNRVRKFFTVEDGFLRHKRIDAELAFAHAGFEQKRTAARARWGNRICGDDANAYANAYPTEHPNAYANGHADGCAPHRSRISDSDSEEESKGKARIGQSLKLPAIPFPELKNIQRDPQTQRPVVEGFYLDHTQSRVLEAAMIDPARWKGHTRALVTWMSDKIEPDTIVDAIRRCAERSGYKVPNTLDYFDKPVREMHGRLTRAS